MKSLEDQFNKNTEAYHQRRLKSFIDNNKKFLNCVMTLMDNGVEAHVATLIANELGLELSCFPPVRGEVVVWSS